VNGKQLLGALCCIIAVLLGATVAGLPFALVFLGVGVTLVALGDRDRRRRDKGMS